MTRLDGTAAIGMALASALGCVSEAKVAVDEVYHLPEQIDAVNLIARKGGEFEWRIFGCDFEGGEVAEWTFDDDTIVVHPVDSGTMHWPGVAPDLTSVVLSPAEDGQTLDVHAIPVEGGDPVDQVWELGGVCAECGGGVGPTGQSECDDPFP